MLGLQGQPWLSVLNKTKQAKEQRKDVLKHSPPRVIGESERVDRCRVTLQFKGLKHLLELSFLPKADLPDLHICGEATRTYKPVM